MNKWSKVVRGLTLLAVAAVLGTLIGWFASRQGDIAPVTVPAPGTTASTPNPSLAIASSAAQTQDPRSVPIIIHEKTHDEGVGSGDGGFPDWEQKLDDILLGDDDENGKADKILALIPNAPPEAQQELAQHLVNMVQDDHYDGAAALLTNSATPADVSNVLMNDLLNRNNNLKLPMLLAIARNPDHPLKDQALDLLGLLTQEDDGTNWDQWSTDIDTWLANNQ